jgi:2-oxoisovalerate dehydrogenase E1 component
VSARRRLRRAALIYERVTSIPDRERHFIPTKVTYVSVGDGATSEGEFWESLNTACTSKLPCCILIEDNGYAISVPVEVQTPGGDISRLVEHFPGCGVSAATAPTTSPAIAHARGGRPRARRKGRRSSTRPSSARTRTRCRTTRSCTRRRPSARPRRAAIRSSECGHPAPRGLATDADLADIQTSIEREVNAAADRR